MSDFIAGGCVGLAQVSIGHPFDTTMVLIQNNKKWMGIPFKNYYKGWRFPLVSASLFNFTVFATLLTFWTISDFRIYKEAKHSLY